MPNTWEECKYSRAHHPGVLRLADLHPTTAQLLLNETGWSPSGGFCIMVLCVIAFAAVKMVMETKGADLHVDEVRMSAR